MVSILPFPPATKSSISKLFPKSDQAQALLKVLANPTRHCTMLIVSDSTGNELDEWAYLLTQYLAAKYPAVTTRYRLWTSNQLYDNADPTDLNFTPAQTATIVNTGTSGYNFDIFNFAISGTKPNHLLAQRYMRAVQEITAQSVYPDASNRLDLVIMNHGHNLFWPDNESALMLSYASAIESILRTHPQAGVICIKQAPWRDISLDVKVTGTVSSYVANPYPSVYDSSKSWFNLLQFPSTLAGTVTVDANGNVTGTGTSFTSQMVGQPITLGSLTRDFEISSYTSATAITVTEIGGGTYTGGSIASGASFYVRPGKYTYYQFRVTSGTGAGQTAQILANSNNRLVFANPFSIALDNTSQYIIECINGTATSATTTVFTDTSKSWRVNSLTNLQARITGGSGIGQFRTITSNTANTFTVSPAWTGTVDATSKYIIENNTVEARHRIVGQYAAMRGFGIADTWEAFMKKGNGPELHIDYLHPSKGTGPTSGSKIIRDCVLEHFIPSPTYSCKVIESTLTTPITNIINNGNFKTWTTTTAAPDNWTVSGGTAAQDTTYYDSSKLYSCKLTATGAVQHYLQYVLSAAEFATLKGKWVTLNVRMMFPSTAVNTTQGRISLATSSESVISVPETPQVGGTVSGVYVGWMWKAISIFVKATDKSLTIKIYNGSASNTSAGETLYIDRVILSEGIYMRDSL